MSQLRCLKWNWYSPNCNSTVWLQSELSLGNETQIQRCIPSHQTVVPRYRALALRFGPNWPFPQNIPPRCLIPFLLGQKEKKGRNNGDHQGARPPPPEISAASPTDLRGRTQVRFDLLPPPLPISFPTPSSRSHPRPCASRRPLRGPRWRP